MTREKGLFSPHLDCRDAGTESPSRRVDEIGFLLSKSPFLRASAGSRHSLCRTSVKALLDSATLIFPQRVSRPLLTWICRHGRFQQKIIYTKRGRSIDPHRRLCATDVFRVSLHTEQWRNTIR